ncbi:hypothetical protein [Spirosoma sp. KNUC1025]|uniref:hypothetical protein n=1 Tax=Spirosoma sp. KNUC1025 TaxID=2894082 RepID=UPI00386FBC24|nr:hypothetical protein LN737_15110 [Spirosoma sp. KNUC1025]
MKKQYSIALSVGLLLVPMLFRATFPKLYVGIWQGNRYVGALLVMVLDILWMWLVMFGIMLSTRLVRWLQNKG